MVIRSRDWFQRGTVDFDRFLAYWKAGSASDTDLFRENNRRFLFGEKKHASALSRGHRPVNKGQYVALARLGEEERNTVIIWFEEDDGEAVAVMFPYHPDPDVQGKPLAVTTSGLGALMADWDAHASAGTPGKWVPPPGLLN